MIGNILGLIVGFVIGMVSVLGGEKDVPTLNLIAFGAIVGFIAVVIVFALTKLRILGDKINVTALGVWMGLAGSILGAWAGHALFF